MLSEAERTEARRHLGYPAHGTDADWSSGWQSHQTSGVVEHRLANLSASEEGVARRYLGTLAVLEQAIPDAGTGLDTGSAAGWVRNHAEVSDRSKLFDDWRRRFCGFLGVSPGPGLGSGRGRVGLVV